MRASRYSAAALAATVLVTSLLLAGGAQSASADEVNPAPSTGQWTVDARGNGHGHGLSQYGARGAAIAGLSATQIIAFYYQGTKLVVGGPVTIRVQITDTPGFTTVGADSGLTIAGKPLTTGGIVRQYRLVPSGAGFAVQELDTGQPWKYRSPMLLVGAQADFARPAGVVRTFHSDGSYTDYRGTVGGVRNGGGQFTVNRLALDSYVRGVVPREMPASWQPAAVQAQAIAARSYARYAVEHAGAAPYDICDTTNCQVYGGMQRFNSAGQFQYGEESGSDSATAVTANQVATWQGTTIFAQFAASNGGMMAAGSQPYLVGKPDPYDDAASGDHWLSYTRTASVAQVASYYGLSRVTQIRITGRTGGGQWGGIVTSGYVDGYVGSSPTSVAVTGPGLANALGVGYQYFHIRQTLPIGRVDSFQQVALHSVRVRGWAMDPTSPGQSTQVRIYVGGAAHVLTANLYRPDVQSAYGTSYAQYGFDATVPIPGGTSSVCTYAMDVALVNHSTLSCSSVSVPVSPLGHVDSVTKVGPGLYQVAGWVFDPDANGGSTQLHVWVDQQAHGYTATGARPDVQSYYGLANDAVGFSVRVPVPAGQHTLCAYGINTVGAGTNQQLRCVPVAG